MAMFRIVGSFRITGAQPDGDAAHVVDGSIVSHRVVSLAVRRVSLEAGT